MIEGAATVVVVDDDLSVRRGLSRLLRSAGYGVETYSSAREFLDSGNYGRASCLVLDVRMPGQNGLDLQEVLTAAGHDTPVIFITGHGDITMAVRAMKAGAADFLAKPFDDTTFLKAVQQAIARVRVGEPPSASPDP
ncbi:MAG TPA: response regulator transcription factor [Candidatus Binatia bacterium]|nr:response regulator transcription factor [Candidatus Binatia bacterium]